MTSHNKETLSGYCSQSVPQRAHCYEQKWCHKNDDSRRSLGHQKMNGQERIHQHTSSRNFVLKFFYHQKYEFLGERRNDMIILHANAFTVAPSAWVRWVRPNPSIFRYRFSNPSIFRQLSRLLLIWSLN